MSTDYDVVVVGTGVAGAIVAWQAASAGLKTLMLDAGSDEFDGKARRSYVKHFAELPQTGRKATGPYSTPESAKFAHSADGPDLSVSKPNDGHYLRQVGPDPFKSQYLRLVGGSTWAWRGNVPRFIPNDFLLKSKYQVAVDWPLTYNEIEPLYCEAEAALGVSGNTAEWRALAARSRPFPMKQIALSYGDLQVKRRLKEFRFGGKTIRLRSLPQARNSERYDGRPACHGNSNCIPLCPIQAKYDATVHVRKAIAAGAELIAKAVVTELVPDATGRRVAEVAYRRWDGSDVRVRGTVVVLATHGIETPKILLMSRQGQGIANSSGTVGKYLMDHPGGEGAALMPFPVFPFNGPQSTSCIEEFRDHKQRGKYCGFRLTLGNDGWGRTKHPYDTLDDLLARRLFGEELRLELRDTVVRQKRIAYTTEQLPSEQNFVTLSSEKDDLGILKPEIHYSVEPYVFDGMKRAQDVIKAIFLQLGVPETDWEFSDLMAHTFSGSAHIMGTSRMGTDRSKSVVDPDGKSHDLENLFIVGASVFPTGGNVNPTLTITALALRTTDALLRDFGKTRLRITP